jgi:hypothetical protein
LWFWGHSISISMSKCWKELHYQRGDTIACDQGHSNCILSSALCSIVHPRQQACTAAPVSRVQANSTIWKFSQKPCVQLECSWHTTYDPPCTWANGIKWWGAWLKRAKLVVADQSSYPHTKFQFQWQTWVNHTDVKISKFHHQRIAEASTEVRWRMASRTHEVSD